MGLRQIDYEVLGIYAERLRRPLSTLIALAPENDPFYADRPSRRAKAEWFTALWERLGKPAPVHNRRLHYALLHQREPVLRWDGASYENTIDCSHALNAAIRDAIALELIPGRTIVDAKNDPAIVNLVPDQAAECWQVGGFDDDGEGHKIEPPPLPRLWLERPVTSSEYHVEIWAEKSTMHDVLLPLGKQFGINIAAASGDFSATACRDLIKRAVKSGKPVRVLYVSDFDPGGQTMPVSVAVKLQHENHVRDLGLDIQVRPVALTYEQCIEYGLPRTPCKDTDRRASHFEARFGEGATELDALEAIHPGVLAKILTAEIERYIDPDRAEAVERQAQQVQRQLDVINKDAAEHFAADMASFEAEYQQIQQLLDDLNARAKPHYLRIAEFLKAKAPDLSAIEWPVPRPGDEDPDPLFDSRREYVEQVDRFKAHQGKTTTRKPRTR